MKVKIIIPFCAIVFAMFATSFVNVKLNKIENNAAIGTSMLSYLDTLQFDIVYGKESDTKLSEKVRSSLSYDFEAQYPYYNNANKLKLKKANRVGISFTRFPSKGYLYSICVDEKDNFIISDELEINNLTKTYTVDSNLVFNFKTPGEKRICVLYSDSPIPNYKSLFQGMEMTYGKFINRLHGQLNSQMLLPNSNWNLLNTSFGFSLDLFKSPRAAECEGSALPIFINLNIK